VQKTPFFSRRKLAKIADNCDHNIDTWSAGFCPTRTAFAFHRRSQDFVFYKFELVLFVLKNGTVKTRVARFILVQNTKSGKNIPNYHEQNQMSIKYKKDRKMDQVSIKYTNNFLCKTLQNLPKFVFLV
jgi:hypothetical protein